MQPKRLSAEFEQHLSAIMNRSRALEHEHRHLMASHGRIIQESNRRAEVCNICLIHNHKLYHRLNNKQIINNHQIIDRQQIIN